MPLFLLLFCSSCASPQTIYVPKPVYVYQPIPAALLNACPGADWSKVITWRDVAIAAQVEKSARASCQAEIDALAKLGQQTH